jgi:hypothetical protein
MGPKPLLRFCLAENPRSGYDEWLIERIYTAKLRVFMRLPRIIVQAIGTCLVASSAAHAGFINGFSYTQTNGSGGGPVTYSNSPGVESTVSDLNSTVTVPNSGTTMTFEARSMPVTSTDLHTYSRLAFDNDSFGTTETWNRIEANVYAEASLVDLATVVAPSGATSGTLLFSWTLNGQSSYSATAPPTNTVGVDILRSDVKLESTIPGFELIIDDPLVAPSFPPLSEDKIDDLITGATGALLFPVSWTTTPMPVEFLLRSSVQLDATALDATQFNAIAESDYYNSAILNGVMILDGSGNVLSDATLQGSNGFTYPTLTSIPEPSSFLLGAVACGVMIGMRLATSSRRQDAA